MRLLSLLLACSLVLGSTPARAQGPAREIVIVEAPQGEPGLDPVELRASVGAELGADAVAPEDPRAAQATGRVKVSVDHAAHALVVEYRGQAEPIRRTVDLPGDAEATERAAVLLAGNLARDEAGELAATLRTPKPAPAPAHEGFVPEEVERFELERLGTTLDFDARWSRPWRTASDVVLGTGVGAVVAGAGLGVVALTTGNHWGADVDYYLLESGNALLVASYLLRPARFDELGALYAREQAQGLPPTRIVDDVESAWVRAARSEHHNRRVVGWLTIVGGTLVTVLAGPAVAAALRPSSADASSLGPWSALGSIGLFDVGIGIDLVLTRGPLERSLEVYEKSTGRPVSPTETALFTPFVAPAMGGGVAGLSGRF